MKKYKLRTGLVLTLVIGLLLHFVLHTFVTFKLGVADEGWMRIVWGWKEIFVASMAVFLLFKFKFIWQILNRNKLLLAFVFIVFFVTLVLGYISLGIHHQSIMDYIISYKYIVFAFVLFLVIALIGAMLPKKINIKLLRYIYAIIKVLLVINIVWWISVNIFPNWMSYLGYFLDIDNILWTADKAPQGIYRVYLWTGAIRNQSLFSGPLSLSFYLMLIWPWFWNKIKDLNKRFYLLWFVIFAINVWLTFSRSLWGIWIIQTVALFVFYFWSFIKKKLLLYILISIGLLGVTISLVMFTSLKKVVFRSMSDAGHKTALIEGLTRFKEKPLYGYGAGSAGPASYHLGEKKFFNPENQYLQLAIEYGSIGMILWLVLFILFPIVMYSYTKNIVWLISWMGIAITGLVLHSFSDTMAMYSFMVISGLSLGISLRKE